MTLTAKDKKQLMVIGVLVLFFIIAAKDSFSRSKKTQERNKRARIVQTFAETGTVSSALTQQGPSSAAAPSASVNGIDPFSGRQVSIGIEEDGTSSFRLSGIVFNAKDSANSYAIINNEVVKRGGTVGDSQFKVTDISDKEVTLCDGKNTLKLKTW